MKNFLIVGASSSIGRALAIKLKEIGSSVISLSKRQPDIPVNGHLLWDARSGDLPALPDQALDGFIYGPGTILLKPFRSCKLADFRDSMELNFLGTAEGIAEMAFFPLADASSWMTAQVVNVDGGRIRVS